MAYYITYGEFQKHMTEYYRTTGKRMQFPEMIEILYQRGLLMTERPADISKSRMFGDISDEEFDQIIDTLILTLSPNLHVSAYVSEEDIIPTARDVFIIRHPRFTRVMKHRHNYFELDFVANGSCTFYFENEVRTMQEGEVCIIAPNSLHDIEILDEPTTVFCIMIRKSTFNTTFFSQLSQKDLLAHFFRTILQGDVHPNYLLFFVQDTKWIKTIVHNAMGECHKGDAYSNTSCINWMNLLFAHLLRTYSQTLQFYHYQMGYDFSLVLQYIQHNYRTLTLSSLAEFFHYSEPHLCTLIKQNTGRNFTELIRQLRMSDAVNMLTGTDLKISEIAERVGYNSADHFSRVFRTTYHMSPQEYRRVHKMEDDLFIPLS